LQFNSYVFAAFFAIVLAVYNLPVLGWRGVAATGAMPIVTSLLIAWIAPESVRWLLSRGRNADARREAAKLLGVPEASVALPNVIEPTGKSGSMSELFHDQKRFWWVVVIWIGISTGTYGVILWGPTILSQLLKIPRTRPRITSSMRASSRYSAACCFPSSRSISGAAARHWSELSSPSW